MTSIICSTACYDVIAVYQCFNVLISGLGADTAQCVIFDINLQFSKLIVKFVPCTGMQFLEKILRYVITI